MERNKIEILAPAGGFDSVVAAVRSGADAVYLGEKSFSARSSAKNFDETDLRQAVAYCHIHGVKVYVTLNTLVFDDEFSKLSRAIVSAAKADVDALIVQNMGVARLAHMLVPDMPLHASTQMSVHTVSGVKALAQLGFKRVVLSREMSREEIARCARVGVELEVFVHGALCMSVSGQCYFSAMLGSRSGNRGACAQTCRLPFEVKGGNGYALSLKDNSLIGYLGELESIGVASAKIEGRMKRPEYVAAAVRACREQLDNGFVSDKTAQLLRAVFSRTGFTDGYYTGKVGKDMFGTRTRDDVVSAESKLLAEIRQGYKDEIRNVKLDGRFTAKLGQPPVLWLSDGVHSVSKTADCVCEKAISVELDEDRCRSALCKTGGTAYSLSLETDIERGISVSVSSLNKLRRDALAELDELRSLIHNYKIDNTELEPIKPYRPSKPRSVRARLADTVAGEWLKSCELVFVPLFSPDSELERLKKEGYPVGVEIPRGMFASEDRISKRLIEVKNLGITDVLCHNIGAVYLAKESGLTVHGGFGLNLVNTFDLLWAEEYGICDAELSFELTFSRINRLGGNIDRGIISYGHLPLMLCRNCPVKNGGMSCKSCKNQSKMQDRKGKSFFLKCDGICTEVLNCLPLYIAEEELSRLSTSFNILRFTVENYVETVENISDLNAFLMLKQDLTRGLYRRGVE